MVKIENFNTGPKANPDVINIQGDRVFPEESSDIFRCGETIIERRTLKEIEDFDPVSMVYIGLRDGRHVIVRPSEDYGKKPIAAKQRMLKTINF